ncbi:MFS transporter [Rhodopila sp.]|uniref:MFS transporter n=1 Tax=Rhodopila sp. TaxID=2480087 RepID=UPI003D0EECCE
MQTPKGAWTVAGMLFLYMLVNFADKAVVGLAAVPIMRELGLSPREYGLLGSSFFLLFSISGVLVGFAANRYSTRWIILLLATVWALAQFPMVGTVSFATLLICRVVLGAGEGPAGSVGLHAIYKWFPDEKRTIPTAILSQGAAVGVVVALPLLNMIIIHASWHWAFGTLGIVGLCWAFGWWLLGREGPIVDPPMPEAGALRVGYSRILLAPTFIGCVVACFGAYWALSLGLTWFTPFVVKALGFSQASAGFISTLPWLMGACTVMLSGWISQVLVARGVSSRAARAMLGCVPLIVGGLLVLAVPHVSDAAAKLALLVVGGGLTGPIYVVCAPMIAEFTPIAQRGAVIAIFGAIYTLAGIIAPYVSGSLIQGAATVLDGYQQGYMVSGSAQIIGGIAGLLLMWPARDRERIRQHRIATAPVGAVRGA